MENNIHINLDDLKKIVNILSSQLNNLDDNLSLILDKDLYWSINEDELYNVYENPKNLTIGSLLDDWLFLQNIITNERKILDYDLNKISRILKFLSNKMLFDKV
jgi:hypothetical protein